MVPVKERNAIGSRGKLLKAYNEKGFFVISIVLGARYASGKQTFRKNSVNYWRNEGLYIKHRRMYLSDYLLVLSCIHSARLQSVFRGFRREGIGVFLRHSCEMSAMLHMCPERNLEWKRRRCIVEHHEIKLAEQFNQSVVEALYPTYTMNQSNQMGWFLNHGLWRQLVQEQNFPMAKVNFAPVIDPIMKDIQSFPCVTSLDFSFIGNLPFPNKTTLISFRQNASLRAVALKQKAEALLETKLPLGPILDVFEDD